MNRLLLIKAHLQENGFCVNEEYDLDKLWKIEAYDGSRLVANIYNGSTFATLRPAATSVVVNIGFRMINIDLVEPGSLDQILELIENAKAGY